MEKRVFTMVEACEYLGGISQPTMHKLIDEGEINSLRIGVRRYFPRESLEAFVDARIGLLGGQVAEAKGEKATCLAL